jgi:hypothetical protein
MRVYSTSELLENSFSYSTSVGSNEELCNIILTEPNNITKFKATTISGEVIGVYDVVNPANSTYNKITSDGRMYMVFYDMDDVLITDYSVKTICYASDNYDD